MPALPWFLIFGWALPFLRKLHIYTQSTILYSFILWKWKLWNHNQDWEHRIDTEQNKKIQCLHLFLFCAWCSFITCLPVMVKWGFTFKKKLVNVGLLVSSEKRECNDEDDSTVKELQHVEKTVQNIVFYKSIVFKNWQNINYMCHTNYVSDLNGQCVLSRRFTLAFWFYAILTL